MTAAVSSRRPIGTVLRLIFALAALVGVSYGVDWTLRAENFPVRNVRFEGPFEHVTHAELEHAMLGLVHGNFFLVDLDAVRRRVETLPWVYRAEVRRRFPQDISVQFTEQRLAARWGDDAWLNTSGEVVRVTGGDLPDGLPKLSGPDGTSAQVFKVYGEFQDTLAAVGLKLSELTLTPRRSWWLQLEGEADDQRVTLVLDHDHPRERVERFAGVYRTNLASDLAHIRQIDLRYTNGFAVQWNKGAAPARFAHHAAFGNEG